MTRTILWAIALIALVVSFDHMMRVDKASLCANDATAYTGC